MVAQSSGMSQAQAVAAQNIAIRNAIVANSLEMKQQLVSNTLLGNVPGQVVSIQPRNVGLIKRFIIKIEGTVAQSGTETLSLTQNGMNNFLSGIVFNDTSNNTRINTTGWHLGWLASMRPANGRQLYGSAYSTDNTYGFGSNYPVLKAPASVTTAQTFRHFYEVPLAYSDTDLRGSILGSILNATMQLQLTVNPNLVVGPGADATLAVYQSSAAGSLGTFSNVTMTVYQVYMDQLPTNANGGVAYPMLDCSCIYELKNTTLQGLVANSDFPIPYANQREFLSTCVIFDNGGQLNVGTDVNYWGLQTANMVNIFKLDPYTASLENNRKILGDDVPRGGYYFDFRYPRRSINTLQMGNMQLVMNPSLVNAGAALYVGWEAFSMINTIVSGGSLPAS